jgi:hypothetical protein
MFIMGRLFAGIVAVAFYILAARIVAVTVRPSLGAPCIYIEPWVSGAFALLALAIGHLFTLLFLYCNHRARLSTTSEMEPQQI